MNQEVKDRIESNVALVEHIVTRMSAGFPDHIDRDDLVQAGMLALVETAGRFDPDRGIAFSTFSGRRIEGAILDIIRGEDWLPRSVRAKARELSATETSLAQSGITNPSPEDVAGAANMSVEDLSTLRGKIRKGVVMALDRPAANHGTATLGDLIADTSTGDPTEGLEEAELREYIRSALHLLPERQRVVIVGYFLEGRPMDELGALLGVTQSRISQIKDAAIQRMREGVDAQYEPMPAHAPTKRRDRNRYEYAAAIADDTKARAERPVAAL